MAQRPQDVISGFFNKIFGKKELDSGIGNKTGNFLGSTTKRSNLVSPLPGLQPLNSQLLSPLASPDLPSPPQATPSPTPVPMQQRIDTGLQQFSPENPVPIASASGALADFSNRVPGKVDPLLAAIMALMESGGGQNVPDPNAYNPYNIGPGINYPNFETSILGGGENNQLGLLGLLREGGPYQDYINSGNLSDFFNKFTPPGPGNPSIEELMNSYNSLRETYFPEQ